jgi:GT2 family glycosyltransferase
MLIRRSVLEALDGLDEGFFLYGEDVDLCRRVRRAAFDIRYEPRATCAHVGGVSTPRPRLLPVLAASRIRYARKHRSRLVAELERVGVGLGALTHVVVARGGIAVRVGHARALAVAVAPSMFDGRPAGSGTLPPN